ncbi:hypothetical protein [Streptomyces sp. NPDC055210]
MTDDDVPQQDEPAEHLRFRSYVNELDRVTEVDEVDVIGAVLADSDQVMAQSAVLRHLDNRAGSLNSASASGYESWVERTTQAVADHPFLTRRLRDWSLVRAVTLAQPWRPDALLEASDWAQLKVAESRNAAALKVLATRGRTKRIRNAARAAFSPSPPR